MFQSTRNACKDQISIHGIAMQEKLKNLQLEQSKQKFLLLLNPK
jgi:hypothetical protein